MAGTKAVLNERKTALAVWLAMWLAGRGHRVACLRRIAIHERASCDVRIPLWRRANAGLRLPLRARLSLALGVYSVISRNPVLVLAGLACAAFWLVMLVQALYDVAVTTAG